MKKRKIKFHYYKAFVQSKENENQWKTKGELSMDTWMSLFKDNCQLQKSVDIGYTKVRLEMAKYREKESLWLMQIMKLRDDNMPSIAKENAQAHAIELDDDEYIGEGLFLLFDESKSIAMIQMNRFSLGITRLAEFFTHVWGTEGERIVFVPILENLSRSWFSRRYSYRMLEVSFMNIPATLEDDHTSLYHIKKQFSETGAVSGSLKLSLGSRRKTTLNIDRTNALIDDALNDECISGLKLHYKDDDDNPVEVIDLLERNLYSVIEFSIQERSILAFDYAVHSMETEYKKKKAKIERLIRYNSAIRGD